MLVSIFEYEWNSRKEVIIDYLKDLFNEKQNTISFDKDGYMNNNYPAPHILTEDNYINHTVENESYIIHMCGYSKIASEMSLCQIM